MKSAAILCAMFLLAGCGDDPLQPGAGSGAAPKAAAPAAKQGPAGKRGAAGPAPVPSDLPALPVRDIQERDFIESATNRDPFRDYADLFVVKTTGPDTKAITREVLVSKYALEELKVIGIITGGAPRAMVSDPSGLGWILRVGDYVGKPEVLHTGGAAGSDVPVNWRVDRIRDNDIVFVREDLSRPDVQATTRVISLRTQDELKPEIKTGIRGSRPDDAAPGAPGPAGPPGPPPAPRPQ
jgi:type IV pilus assembly protein PilP